MIARVLDAEGYKVGVIECPDWKGKDDFLKLGRPRLFFGVTSGSIDSMLVNYTPLKRERSVDPNAPFASRMPDRAVIVYANRIRELHKGARDRPRRHRGLAPALRPLRLLGRRRPPLHPPRHARRHPRLRAGRAPGRRDRPPARPGRDARRHPRHGRRPRRAARGRARRPVLRGGPGRQGQVLRGPEASHEPQDDRPEARQPLRRPIRRAGLYPRRSRPRLRPAVHPPHPRELPRAGHGPVLGPDAPRLPGPLFVLLPVASPGRPDRLPQRALHPRGDPAHDQASGVARHRRRSRRPDGQHVRPGRGRDRRGPSPAHRAHARRPQGPRASRRSSSAAASATTWPSRAPSTCASWPAITSPGCSRSRPNMSPKRSSG